MSGISRYEVTVNSGEPIINNPEYSFLPQPPGEYMVRVKTYDKAGNSIEDRVKIEILPIETPTISSISKKIIIGTNSPFVVKGTAIADTSVIITIEDKNKFLVLQDEKKTNPQGEWEFRLDKELRRGDYLVNVKAKDSRGALSIPTEPAKVSFAEKPVISFFGLDITTRGLIIILLVVGTAAALYFWRRTLLHLARSQRESVIISRDLKNAFGLVRAELDKTAGIIKRSDTQEQREIEFEAVSKRIESTLEKIENYLSKDIEKLE